MRRQRQNDQAERLRAIVDGQFASRADTSERPYVITITSGKGGVGKSNIACNLALKLGDLGATVLLVDGDENLGTLDLLVNAAPRYRMADVLRGVCTVDDALVQVEENVKLLAGNSGDLAYPLLSYESQRHLIRALLATQEPFSVVIIDTAAGISDTTIEYARASNLTVVVSHSEPTALLDAYALIKLLHHASPSGEIKILMNAIRRPFDGDEAVAKLQTAIRHFLKIDLPYLGIIPYDHRVSEAITRQEPLVRCFPSSSSSLSLGLLARSLAASIRISAPKEVQVS
jgi:flagellar biosynthesis protein FlhG